MSLQARLAAYLFLDAFVLLYPVYALLFEDTGLSTAEISSLFVVWAVVALVVEIPSGVWADAVSRRLLLVLAPLLTGAGFALWVLVPSFPAFAVGFVLWGTGGSLQSGALESLVYDELHRTGTASRYAAVMGRGRAAGAAALTAGTALAAPVLAVGGYLAVGAASVATCLAAALVARSFPEHRGAVPNPEPDPEPSPEPSPEPNDQEDAEEDDEAEGFQEFVRVLREGVAEVRGRPAVLAAVLLVPAVAVIWGSLEEYLPLLAAGTGASAAAVPLLLLVVSVGQSAGGLLAGRGPRDGWSGRRLAALIVLGAVLLAAGSLLDRPAGFVLLAVAFGAFQLATVTADARLQQAITGRARSTVTSLAGFLTDVSTIGVYGLYAAGSAVAGHPVLFAVAALGYLVLAAVLVAPGISRSRRTRRTRRQRRVPVPDAR